MQPTEMKLEITLLKKKINLMEEWIKDATDVIHFMQNHLFDLEDQRFRDQYMQNKQ
jgi:hypothetical protein